MDVTLNSEDRTLIIDAKRYGQILIMSFERKVISRDNCNQIFVYDTHSHYEKGKSKSGMLLYAQIEHKESIGAKWNEAGYSIWRKTFNLND